jgi:hypothetical protein
MAVVMTPGYAVDVAADDHHRAHFRDGAPEAGQNGRGETEPRLRQQRSGPLPPAQAHGAQLIAIFRVEVLQAAQRDGGDDRRD